MKASDLDLIELGTFELTREVLIISDPYYDFQSGRLGHVFDAKMGIWKAAIGMKDEGKWGKRIAFLSAFHVDSPDIRELTAREADFAVGVASGQAGIFDRDHYRGSSLIPSQPEDEDSWYDLCCDQTSKTEHQAGIIPYGVVAMSGSGYGNGTYRCTYYTSGENEHRVTWGVLINFNLEQMSRIMELLTK